MKFYHKTVQANSKRSVKRYFSKTDKKHNHQKQLFTYLDQQDQGLLGTLDLLLLPPPLEGHIQVNEGRT